MTAWEGRQCVLCAVRGRETRLAAGHCCAACAARLLDDLRRIPELAAMAAASLVPGSGTGVHSAAYGSRPPLNVEALDPALAHVPGHDAPLLVLLEEWARLILEMRGMSKYGPWSAAQMARRALIDSGSWENRTTKDPGEAATSRGVTDHREG